MELFVALIVIFLGGTGLYGLSQLVNGGRDLGRELPLLWRRPALLREAREGRVLLRGRARAVRRLLPALTGSDDGCVAQRTRSGYGGGGEQRFAVFELVDESGVARIEADRLQLVAEERSDVFGDLTSEIAPGDEVWVEGRLERRVEPDAAFDSFREPPTAMVVRDQPGRGVRIVRPTMQPLRTLAKGGFALAVSVLATWLTVAMMG